MTSVIKPFLAVLLAAAALVAHAAAPRHGDAPLPGIGGELEGVDADGRPFSLARLDHRSALVFFGATSCSSSCPVALAVAKAVLDTPSASRPPAIVFVTLDPLSDDPARLHAHLATVHPGLVGLTGSPAQIARDADRYGVARAPAPGTVAHSARWYLLDRDGRVARTYPLETSPADLREDALRLLRDAP